MTAATIAARRACPDRSAARIAHRPAAPSAFAFPRRRQALRRQARARRHRPRSAGGPVPRHHRQERLRQEHPAPAARRSGPADVRDARSTATAARTAQPTRIMFQEPRLLPWARVVDNVAVGLTGLARGDEARERALGDARRGGPRRPRRRLAVGAVGRPAAARRSGPRAGRPAANPGPRRAARRARRADPHRDAGSAGAHLAEASSSPRCWSPTTSPRRSRSPTAWSSSIAAGSLSTSKSPLPVRDGTGHRNWPSSKGVCWITCSIDPSRPLIHLPTAHFCQVRLAADSAESSIADYNRLASKARLQ